MVWIKICGITNAEDALKVSDLGADALGFIFSTDSARKINSEDAKKIIITVTEKFKNNPIKKQPSMVGVFVNEDINKVLSITKELGFDYIQLSGNESVEYLKEIKKHNKIIKLIKLIRIKNNSLFNKTISDKIQDFKNYADFFLLDTFKNNIYGGTGEPFNWMFVENWGQEIPVILAGGLDSENVAGAIKIVKPFGVDASTRLEKSPGKKDIKKVDLFIKNAASLFL